MWKKVEKWTGSGIPRGNTDTEKKRMCTKETDTARSGTCQSETTWQKKKEGMRMESEKEFIGEG